MPSLKDIRSRIQSTKNTQQITRAMKMVSAAKLRKAQMNILNSRPYAQRVLSVIADIAATQRIEHELLGQKESPQKILMVVLTSDRGFCGSFNSNIGKFADRYYRENKEKYEKIDFLFIGRKGRDFMIRRHPKINVIDTVLNLAKDVSYDLAADTAKKLIHSYLEGEYDEIRMVYNTFRSAISQVVTCDRLLPVDLSASSFDEGKNVAGFSKDFIFEPSPEVMVDELVKKHFAVQVYRCMSESIASEHGARMNAMENATKNAGELISSLTLTYNKLRQASITTELIEITSGAEALNG